MQNKVAYILKISYILHLTFSYTCFWLAAWFYYEHKDQCFAVKRPRTKTIEPRLFMYSIIILKQSCNCYQVG